MNKKALLLTLILFFLGTASLLWILLHSPSGTSGLIPWQGSAQGDTSGASSDKVLIADIYQNGSLLQSICLTSVEEPYTFTVTGEGNVTNEIEVRNGSIGIISASCPDKLCVHQGFISGSLLPITCLPNRLVIQVRESETDNITPDIITY